MSQPLSGPGVGLPLPQALYPSPLNNAPLSSYASTNEVCLNAGDQLPLPAGTFYVSAGSYCVIQYRDPVNNTWRAVPTTAGGAMYIKSDGFNYRVANLLGCPVGGVVVAPGNGSYVQATTSIAVTGGGGSLWSPIIGGQIGGNTVVNVGAGYGVPPIVMLPAPAGPNSNANGVGGIQAAAYAVIANGTVSGVTMTNPGAGYSGTTITALLLPNPTDPNISTGITQGSVTFSVIAAGSLTGVLCTQPGNPLSSPNNITLTVSGAGANGTVSPIMMQTVTAVSVVGTATISGATGAGVTSLGGAPPQGTFTNSPPYLYLANRPRPLQAGLTVGGTGTVAAQTGTIYDGGLFYSAPAALLQTLQGPAAVGSVIGSATVTLVTGSRPDIVQIMSAP